MLGFSLGLALWLFPSGRGHAHGAIHERMAEVSREIEAHPRDARLFAKRADLERRHGDWSAALEDIERARQLDPAMDLDLLLGRTLAESGHPKEALPLITGALGRNPDDPEALVARARAARRLDQRKNALADYRRALDLTCYAEPALVLECADCHVAEGLEKEAVKILAAAIEKAGPSPALALRAMELEIATRDFDAALGRVAAMRESAPRPEPWMARRAAILGQAGRNRESLEAWRDLVTHIGNLPNLDRGAPPMVQLMEEAKAAAASLERDTETTGTTVR